MVEDLQWREAGRPLDGVRRGFGVQGAPGEPCEAGRSVTSSVAADFNVDSLSLRSPRFPGARVCVWRMPFWGGHFRTFVGVRIGIKRFPLASQEFLYTRKN